MGKQLSGTPLVNKEARHILIKLSSRSSCHHAVGRIRKPKQECQPSDLLVIMERDKTYILK